MFVAMPAVVASSLMPEAPTEEVLPALALVLSMTVLASPQANVTDLANVTVWTPFVLVDVVLANCLFTAHPAADSARIDAATR